MTLVHACSCISERGVAENFQDSSTVFSGEALSIRNSSSELATSYGSNIAIPVHLVTFSIFHTWKGSTSGAVVVQTNGYEASCGYAFLVREAYLVYANGAPNHLETSLCSGNEPLSAASGDIATLNLLSRGVPPFVLVYWPVILALMVAIAVSTFLLIRRQSKAEVENHRPKEKAPLTRQILNDTKKRDHGLTGG